MENKNICLISCTLPIDDKMIIVWNELAESLDNVNYKLVLLTTTIHSEMKFSYINIPFTLDNFDSLNIELPDESHLDESVTALSMTQREIEWFGKEKDNWLKHFNGYYKCKAFYRSVIQSLIPSVILAWQNSLPQSNILKRLAEEYSIPNLVIERGMLPDTFMLEKSGHVALSNILNDFSIRKVIKENSISDNYEAVKKYFLSSKPVKYNQKSYEESELFLRKTNFKDKPLVVYFSHIDSAVGLYPEDTMLSQKTRLAFHNTKETVSALSNLAVRNNFHLIIKLHPHDNNNYEDNVKGNTEIIKDFNYQILMEKADVLAFSCTTLQFEALLYEKPILLLCRSELSGLGIAYEALSEELLTSTLELATNRIDFEKKIIKSKQFIHWVSNNFLFSYYENTPIANTLKDMAAYVAELGANNDLQPFEERICKLDKFLKSIDYDLQYTHSGFGNLNIDKPTMNNYYNNIQSLKLLFSEYEANCSNYQVLKEIAEILLNIESYNEVSKIYCFIDALKKKQDKLAKLKAVNKEIDNNNYKTSSYFSEEAKYEQFIYSLNSNKWHNLDELAELTKSMSIFEKIKVAEILVNKKNLSVAKQLLELVLIDEPENIYALNDYAIVLIVEKDYNNAFECIQRVLKNEPTNKIALDSLTFLKDKVDKIVLEKNVDKDIVEKELLIEAENLIEFGKYDEAKKLLESILNHNTQNTDALNDLAAVHILQKNYYYAEYLINEILRNNPQNQVAKENKSYIESLGLTKLSEHIEVVKFFSQSDFNQYTNKMKEEQERRNAYEMSFIRNEEPFYYMGKCSVCNKEANFSVDYMFSHERDGKKIPNWRERIVCPSCNLNNRMRAFIHFVNIEFSPNDDSKIYLTEQTTALFKYYSEEYKSAIGSEYLGETVPLGVYNNDGLRNEDIVALTFPDNEFDLILSLDVLEHVPDFQKAFKEMYRVLKPNGKLIFSVPFAWDSSSNIIRAVVKDDGIHHLLPPEYHGDPINSDGCLCYQYFGWEVIDNLKSVSFQEVYVGSIYSRQYGYLGRGNLFFVATKQS
jgi:SAM-dependent methyltransferase